MIRKLNEATKRVIRNRMVDAFQIATAVSSVVALNYALTFSGKLLSAPSDWMNIVGAAFGVFSCVLIPTGAIIAVLIMDEYKLK